MKPSCALLLLALLVVCHTSMSAIFESENLNCRCGRVISTFIPPSRYASIKITLPGISCRRTEVIITLKTRRSVCVDPEVKWVKALLAALKHKDPSQKTNEGFQHS